jgi:hypothetical protein
VEMYDWLESYSVGSMCVRQEKVPDLMTLKLMLAKKNIINQDSSRNSSY